YKSHIQERKVSFSQSRTVRRVDDGGYLVDVRPRRASVYGRGGSVIASRPSRTRAIPSLGERLRGERSGEPVSWTGVVIGIGLIFVVGLLAFTVIMPHSAVFQPIWFAENTLFQPSTPAPKAQPVYGASQGLVRVSQLNPSQYSSTAEFNLWAYSACSTAAITEVINAYGHHYRIADILKVESSLNEITPALGLVEDAGIANTVAKFGFKTSWGYNLTYDQVVATANKGEPVIVAWPPSRYDGGHLVVVLGGNSQTVDIADSSLYNRHSLSRAQFMQWWAGFSAIVTPQ
ncbi:MAG TPA: cysteine peptidase family C39 domain-containing protein, partial [Ktedonobacteraceae bacterium]|nr:cysteine peptidase family C39 domain-containing protein [Ktedonobacteraceae bacterium]